MPYGDDPANDTSDALRLYVGDTDTSDQQLTDNEVAYLLAQESNVLRAAAMGARVLAGKYARQVDSEIDEIRLRAQERFNHYVALAKELTEMATTSGGGMKLTGIFFGGISKSIRDSNRDDDSLIQPAFNRELHEHEGSGGILTESLNITQDD